MRTKRLVLLVAGLLAMLGSVPFITSAGAAPADKVTICHATNSATNPYEQIEVSENAVDGKGGGDHFAEHKGGVVQSEAEAQALKKAHVPWGDIIPPVPPFHNGLNYFGVGLAIYNNGCNFLTVVTTTQPPSSTTQPPSSTTQPPSSTTVPPGKVTICHRTNSAKNPYVVITPSVNGALNGHAGHTGPIATSLAVAQSLKAQHIKWGDIIPPIPGLPNGLNWPAGQSILNAGCTFAPPPPSTTTPPPTTKAPTTTTKAPTTTTKAPPPPSTKAPTTTTKAPTTTTKAPPPVTLVRVEPPKPGAPLAFTGSDTGRIAGIALLMIGIGFVLMSRYRRPQLLTVGTSTNAPAFRSVRKRDGQPLVPVDETMHDGGVDADEESLTSLWVQAHEAIDLLNKWIATTRRRDEE